MNKGRKFNIFFFAGTAMPINRLAGRKRSQTVQREGVHKNKTGEHINYDRSG